MEFRSLRSIAVSIVIGVTGLWLTDAPVMAGQIAGFKRDIGFNAGWKFQRGPFSGDSAGFYSKTGYDDSDWEDVTLPHTPRIEPLVVNDQWQGICWYRKRFTIDDIYRDKKVFIEFEGAMQVADVWVNGRHATTHYGGYLPFTIDISDDVVHGKPNLISVRLDNRDNQEVPPGKPLKDLDFSLFGGLYRNVNMHITDQVYITDAVHADEVAGGGVFVRYPVVSDDSARVWVQTHVVNEYSGSEKFRVVSRIMDNNGQPVTTASGAEFTLGSMEDRHIEQTLLLQDPNLWFPDSPYLYELHSLVYSGETLADSLVTPIGIRRFSISPSGGFTVNGKSLYLRGTNRHQEYPYVGYALSDNAHYRDAKKIKEAGFNFVRLSHYPHSESFMNALDELGLLAMDAIPGWQFFGDDTFQQRSYQDMRDMIRRDRNHPSVILWEVSLNESGMTEAFMDSAHRIAHEEYPGDQCYSAGWMDYAYDVFIPARQHRKAPHYWEKYDGGKPLFIAEYGDWEYYAHNAGFNQPQFANLTPAERNSRQLRGFGQVRLLQQALNYQEAYNDNLESPAFGCANWLMFDYNRGYADNIEASGIMDLFRIPKFAYYLYRSQRPPRLSSEWPDVYDPMVEIADYWMENADGKVKVFSNCEQVELLRNGESLAIRDPDQNRFSDNLNYPPFTFPVDLFEPGELRVVGYINGQIVAADTVRTPGAPGAIRLNPALDGIAPIVGEKDLFFVYAELVDSAGTVVSSASDRITFRLSGPGRLVGENPVNAEAGIATVLVETMGKRGQVVVEAFGAGLVSEAPVRISIK